MNDLERKDELLDGDSLIEPSPTDVQLEDYLKNGKWEEKRDDLIKSYNNKANERILSILLMMKLWKDDDSIINKLIFQIKHKCKYRKEECYLDKMVLFIRKHFDDEDIMDVARESICMCEEGMKYFFRIMRLINPTKLKFTCVSIPVQSQSLFGLCFSQLLNLEELYLAKDILTCHFIESFVKSIASLNKLKYINLQMNPIGSSFKFLLPYLHLLINDWSNGMDLEGMNLDDESVMLLSSELYKYPNLEKIVLWGNKNIHSIGLKSLFSKFPILEVGFDFNRNNKELLIDKDIAELVKYRDILNLKSLGIDDIFFKSFISLRLNEFGEIGRLDLNNKLTIESIEILINNLSSLPNLKVVWLNGNEIGDVGMKILSPHLHVLKEMGLSSTGLKYLLDGLKNIHVSWSSKIWLDISENNIDSSGIEYLVNYLKENDNIEKLFIHNNPMGNNGFKLILNNLDMLRDDYPSCKINLSNISINDESVMLLSDKLDSVRYCKILILSGNNIKMDGLKSICEKSLENDKYPFIGMKCSNWRNEELEYYVNYCIKKKREDNDRKYDFSNMNLNDSHILLIKQIDYLELDLSCNKISFKGLKELTDSLPKDSYCISIFGNEIGDEGIEIICKYINMFIKTVICIITSLNLSNIGMSERGLKMLIERLKWNLVSIPIDKIDISGNELNESELRLMKENEEVFDYLEELSVTVKENINRDELKSFIETFSSIGKIEIDGINEEEKKELSKEFYNIE